MIGRETPDPISAVAELLVEVFEVEAVVVEILVLLSVVPSVEVAAVDILALLSAVLAVEVFEAEVAAVETLALVSVALSVEALELEAIFAAPDLSVPAAAVAAIPVEVAGLAA